MEGVENPTNTQQDFRRTILVYSQICILLDIPDWRGPITTAEGCDVIDR